MILLFFFYSIDKIRKKKRSGNIFNLVSKFNPSGDQPEAINKLVYGIKSGENVDGTKHDNKTLDNLPKKVKDKARGSKTYKKGKENQKKTDAAKIEIKRRGLHWNNALQAVAIVAILVLFGIACYFTGGAALIFA